MSGFNTENRVLGMYIHSACGKNVLFLTVYFPTSRTYRNLEQSLTVIEYGFSLFCSPLNFQCLNF